MNGAAHRRARALSIAAGLVGTPALWVAQMLVSQMLSATACYRLGAVQAAPRWPHVEGVLAVIAGAAFAAAIACAALAVRAYRRASGAHDGGTRSSTRFLAQCGALVAAGFVVGLVFTGIVAGFVEPCSRWH